MLPCVRSRQQSIQIARCDSTNRQHFDARLLMSRIFGIGWAKTGTTTLGRCFEILGFDHQSQQLDLVGDLRRGDLSRILALAGRKQTFEDWPWLLLYRELDQAFPGSRFVLTRRDSSKWLRSYQNMLRGQGEATGEMNEVRRILYDLPFPHVTGQMLIARYQRHNDAVLAYFHNRPECLLVVDWEQGHGWKDLCGFLGRPIPTAPFPHANRGNYGSALPPEKHSEQGPPVRLGIRSLLRGALHKVGFRAPKAGR